MSNIQTKDNKKIDFDFDKWEANTPEPEQNTEDEKYSDGLPEIINFGEIEELPELAPELISGILRRGHKMLIAGPSKAGKSFLLIELAICISSGEKWLGHECYKGRVLYINLEVDEASFLHRIDRVCKALGLNKCPQNLDVWNLRGFKADINNLEPRIINRIHNKQYQYDCIIFDPIYKINLGDENSASETGDFFNHIDSIGKELNASVVLCHHHSKGTQGGKFSIDRSSGSGVFARDPDALIDMIQLDPKDVDNPDNPLDDGLTVWRMSFTLREFRNPEDIDVVFDFPLHRITYDFTDAKPMSGADSSTNSKRGNREKQKIRDMRFELLCNFVRDWKSDKNNIQHTPHPTIKDATEHFKNDDGFSASNIRTWIKDTYCDGPLKYDNHVLYLE